MGDALVRGDDATVACAAAGERLARSGACLGEALEGLRAAALQATGRQPTYAATAALAVAWAEQTISVLQQVTCEEPLTGVARPAHLRTRLAEVYRGAQCKGSSVRITHALVVCEIVAPSWAADGLDALDHALWLVQIAERVRRVFAGEDTLCAMNPGRLVVLTRRTPELGERVLALRTLLRPLGQGDAVWIEGLPPSFEQALRVLGDLCLSA